MENTALFLTTFHLTSRSPLVDYVMSIGAEYVILLSFLLALVLAVKGGATGKKALFYILISLPLVIILIKLIHIFVYTDRPFVTYNFEPLASSDLNASFPSRHVSVLSAVAFAYIFTKSKFAPLQLLFLFWVGIARVYSGVHYPVDILGGVLTGLVSVLMATKISKLSHL